MLIKNDSPLQSTWGFISFIMQHFVNLISFLEQNPLLIPILGCKELQKVSKADIQVSFSSEHAVHAGEDGAGQFLYMKNIH